MVEKQKAPSSREFGRTRFAMSSNRIHGEGVWGRGVIDFKRLVILCKTRIGLRFLERFAPHPQPFSPQIRRQLDSVAKRQTSEFARRREQRFLRWFQLSCKNLNNRQLVKHSTSLGDLYRRLRFFLGFAVKVGFSSSGSTLGNA